MPPEKEESHVSQQINDMFVPTSVTTVWPQKHIQIQ